MDEALRTNVFPYLVLDFVMIGMEHNLLTKFFKMKPPIFQGTESEDALMFIIDCYERLHKMGIIQQQRFEFVTFLQEKDAKQQQGVYVECQSLILPLSTWKKFHALFIEKYMSCTLRNCKKDELFAVERGDMLVAAYEAKFYALPHNVTQLLATEKERIRRYVKALNYDLQVLSGYLTSAWKGLMKCQII